ncbi:MAG TPA: hypothetical protein VMQ62_00940 [Dongiaceae bacterium]|nr:hypothetical protein [Dongiaceae bacterium]
MRSHRFLRALVAALLVLMPAASTAMAAVRRPAACCSMGARACCCRPGARGAGCRLESPCGSRETTTATSAMPAPALLRTDVAPAAPAPVPFAAPDRAPSPVSGSRRPPDPPPETTD